MKIDPQFKALIPPLAPEELAQLEANLLADGCRDPLVVWRGGKLLQPKDSSYDGYCKGENCLYERHNVPKSRWVCGSGRWECPNCQWGIAPWEYEQILLDGHNRYEICQRHGIKFKTVEIELADRDAAMVWIIRNQFGRRNITLTSRCELAEALAEALKPKAKENQKQSKGQGKKGSPILADLKVDTREQAAKEAGVSHGSLAAFRFLKENATPEEIDALKSDHNAKLHRVVKEVKDRKAKSTRKSKRVAAAKTAKMDSRIIIGDFRKHSDKVADGSLSLIFTDPPYDREASKMLPALAEFAKAKLADGGSLVMYLGHLQLPAAFLAFDGKLRHWWTCCCLHSGEQALMREYGIRVGWKPMLWFVKGTRDDKSNIINDTVSGGREKGSHDWQQSESEAAHWIDALCPKDGLVCDPFLGGGTTAAVAHRLKREWIGFEIDPSHAASAAKRIA